MSVRLGDGVKALERMRGQDLVHLLLTDLPSGQTQAKFDKAVDLIPFFAAARHALHPKGVCVVFASHFVFARQVLEDSSLPFLYDLVWHKSVATGFLNAKKRPLRSHEHILVFGRPGSTYNVQMQEGATPIHAARRRAHGENYGAQTQVTNSRAGATDRFPTSVLSFASVGTSSKERVHPQQKPVPLLRWLVRAYSNPGDLVVDPFAGSGSTLKAALLEGRRAKGWDISPRFAK
jgi:site-specific DNA-methyltransferase (adenine-specific)